MGSILHVRRASRRTSHALGIFEAIALGRAVGRVPAKARALSAIEPADLGWGEGLSDAVARSIDVAADLVVEPPPLIRSAGRPATLVLNRADVAACEHLIEPSHARVDSSKY